MSPSLFLQGLHLIQGMRINLRGRSLLIDATNSGQVQPPELVLFSKVFDLCFLEFTKGPASADFRTIFVFLVSLLHDFQLNFKDL